MDEIAKLGGKNFKLNSSGNIIEVDTAGNPLNPSMMDSIKSAFQPQGQYGRSLVGEAANVANSVAGIYLGFQNLDQSKKANEIANRQVGLAESQIAKSNQYKKDLGDSVQASYMGPKYSQPMTVGTKIG